MRLVFALAAAAVIAGCSPSVRYTRGGQPPPPSPDQQRRSGGAEQQQAQAPQDQTRRPAQNQLERVANSYLGAPYKYGGMSRRGFDCSGFVTVVFREVYNKELPRSSVRMWRTGVAVPLSAARPGDLVFFKGGRRGAIDHVGIYMGKKRFIHASTSKGVVYSHLDEAYYSRRFAGVRRVV